MKTVSKRFSSMSAMLLAGATLLVPTLSPAIAADDAEPELNKAQTTIFMDPHLGATKLGQTLIYDFSSHITGEPDKADQVKMTVTGEHADDKRDLSFDFLSGDEHLPFPSATGYRGNPVAIQFLERDIRLMSQKTGTPVVHFRNRMRKAFGENPQINEITTEVNGKQVAATEIKLQPFTADPTLAKIDGYPGKEYLFIYSPEVPGDLVKIQTQMHSEDGDREEQLLYHGTTGGE